MSDAENKLQEYLAQDLAQEKLRNAELIRLRRLTAIAVIILAATTAAVIAACVFMVHTTQAAYQTQFELALQAKKEICQLQAAHLDGSGSIAIISQHGTTQSVIQAGK